EAQGVARSFSSRPRRAIGFQWRNAIVPLQSSSSGNADPSLRPHASPITRPASAAPRQSLIYWRAVICTGVLTSLVVASLVIALAITARRTAVAGETQSSVVVEAPAPSDQRAEAQESGVRNQESGVGNQESGVGQQELAIRNPESE